MASHSTCPKHFVFPTILDSNCCFEFSVATERDVTFTLAPSSSKSTSNTVLANCVPEVSIFSVTTKFPSLYTFPLVSLIVESTPFICTLSISKDEPSFNSTSVTGFNILFPVPLPSP